MDASTLWLRVAAGVFWLNGLGFGAFCVPSMMSIARGEGYIMVFGFPAYGGGPFERLGIRTTVALLAAFLLVCALELVAGWLVWNAKLAGAVLGLVLLVPGALFWWGFALPIPWILGVARTWIVVAYWRYLS